MDRIPEPELMLDESQARAYARADFEEPHRRFLELLRERLPQLPDHGQALDLGCGPGDISLRFARAYPGWTLDALDGSPAMLELGREAARAAGLADRVRFFEAYLPSSAPPHPSYDLVLSNSLLHHLREPASLWHCVRRWSSRPGWVFVMDLLRPSSPSEAAALVDRYARHEPEELRSDFYHSLLAAYRPSELAPQLEEAGLSHLELAVTSDRHLIVWGEV